MTINYLLLFANLMVGFVLTSGVLFLFSGNMIPGASFTIVGIYSMHVIKNYSRKVMNNEIPVGGETD